MDRAARIGEASKKTGLSIDAIRFYEREGLLGRPHRTAGGFRLFGPGDLSALRFIRSAQELGFSLAEIRELLLLRDDGLHACTHVRDLLARKLGAIGEKIAELGALEKTLQTALGRCNRELRAKRSPHQRCCPVLAEMTILSGKGRRPK